MFPHLNLKLSLNLIILYFNFHHPTAANKTKPTKPTNPDKCFCELSNKLIHDTNCLCDVNQLINFNQNHVRPTMQKLMKTDYFRYFKTNVDKGCEYWDEPYVCTTNQCGLAPCTPTELPPILAADSEKGSSQSSQNKAKEDDFRDQVSEDQNLENKEESCSDQSNQENKYKILTSKLSELINSKSNSIHVNSILDDDITDIDVESNPIILTPTEVKDMQKHWDQHDEEQNKQNKAIWQKSFTHDDLVMNAEGNQQQDGNCKYYDLLKNPERYTGYGGPPAHRVWRKIYEENCYAEKEISTFTNPASNLPFGSMPGMQHLVEENKDKEWYRKPNEVIKELNCVEKRVFFRAVSGLHSSISLHLSYIWFFPEEGVFKPNLDEFIRRFENENGRVYIENLYFVWLMELRALAKATAYLTNPNNIREIVHTGDVLSDIKGWPFFIQKIFYSISPTIILTNQLIKLLIPRPVKIIQNFPSLFRHFQTILIIRTTPAFKLTKSASGLRLIMFRAEKA